MLFRVTADELELLPYDRKRREVIRGRLHVPRTPDRVHQEAVMRLAMLLMEQIEDVNADQVYMFPATVRFSPDTQVQPDLIAIRNDRMGIFPINIVHGAPDIVIEVVYPETSQLDLVEKKQLYAENGVPEYWIVDPALRTLLMLQLNSGVYTEIKPNAGRLHSTAILDFTIDPASPFARADVA